MPRRPRALFAAGFTLLLLAPCALGHNAPPAPEQYVRFLSDCSDDWGGHSAVRDGHDLVAVDVSERWIPQHGEPGFFVLLTVGFGFSDTGSQGGPLRDEVEFASPKGPVKVRLATNDNKEFTAESGQGLRVPDVLLPVRPSLLPSGTQDGSRQLVEFGFRYSSLGLAIGDKITDMKVQAYARQERGDYMPGGYYLLGVSSGGERDCPQSGHQGGSDPGTLYVRPDYTLVGTEEPFLSTSTNTDAVAVSGNQSGFLTLTLTNKFAKQPQTFRLVAGMPAAWDVRVEPATASAEPAGTASFSIVVQAVSGMAENTSLAVSIDSDAGGHATRNIPVYWYPPGIEASLPRPASPDGVPAAPAALLLIALSALVFMRRARHSA